ncbi:MAG TPA: MarR family transcriptional regulator [Candidatus Acidoferrum sp.]|nr:MarR family transcriptional regulator [Candidatus Acidoferrum sp.]
MNDFEKNLNDILVETFNTILKYEESALKTIASIPLTVAEAHMLEAIQKNGGVTTISDLAARLAITLPTTTVAVKKLEKKGFVMKAPSSSDGRSFVVSLTDLGKRVDRAHSLFHQRMVKSISREFDEGQQEVLITAIEKLNTFFKEKAGM